MKAAPERVRLESSKVTQTFHKLKMLIKNLLLVATGLFILGGCSSHEDLPTAGQGGTPPPFKKRIEEGMAKRAAATTDKGADHPNATSEAPK